MFVFSFNYYEQNRRKRMVDVEQYSLFFNKNITWKIKNVFTNRSPLSQKKVKLNRV